MPEPRKTVSYSFVSPDRIVNIEEDKKVEPTIPMAAVNLLAAEVLTVKNIVHRLLERNLKAWRALPESIRDRMLDRPQDFNLIGNKLTPGDFDYDILYNGTVWRYNVINSCWLIQEII